MMAAGRFKPIKFNKNEILCVVEKKKSVKKNLMPFSLYKIGKKIFHYALNEASSMSINAVSNVRIEFIFPRVVGSTVLAKYWALLIIPL
jgi:hypothetical protein